MILETEVDALLGRGCRARRPAAGGNPHGDPPGHRPAAVTLKRVLNLGLRRTGGGPVARGALYLHPPEAALILCVDETVPDLGAGPPPSRSCPQLPARPTDGPTPSDGTALVLVRLRSRNRGRNRKDPPATPLRRVREPPSTASTARRRLTSIFPYAVGAQPPTHRGRLLSLQLKTHADGGVRNDTPPTATETLPVSRPGDSSGDHSGHRL